MPGRIYVCIEVLLSGFASADTVARVIIGKDVAVDASAKADVETAHLPKVNCITMGEEHRESGRTKGSHLNGKSQSNTNSKSSGATKYLYVCLNSLCVRLFVKPKK